MSKSKRLDFLNKVGGLPGGQFWLFGIKQAWAALFGGLMLLAIIITSYVELPWLPRYDWLFIIALATQAFMLLTRLEKPHEVITITCFHLVGLGMELFKTSSGIGSWSYPEESYIVLGNVPLFSGFMYAAVGSYIARSWRIMNLTFTNYPKRLYTLILALAIYVNFFTHHYMYDFRYILFAALIWLYSKCWVSYTISKTVRRMPILISALLITFFIWIAENIGTLTKAWLYPNQTFSWDMVRIGMLGSWLLLMIISFIMVDLLHYLRTRRSSKKITNSDF